jgi:two-component sensor histidine kinase
VYALQDAGLLTHARDCRYQDNPLPYPGDYVLIVWAESGGCSYSFDLLPGLGLLVFELMYTLSEGETTTFGTLSV